MHYGTEQGEIFRGEIRVSRSYDDEERLKLWRFFAKQYRDRKKRQSYIALLQGLFDDYTYDHKVYYREGRFEEAKIASLQTGTIQKKLADRTGKGFLIAEDPTIGFFDVCYCLLVGDISGSRSLPETILSYFQLPLLDSQSDTTGNALFSGEKHICFEPSKRSSADKSAIFRVQNAFDHPDIFRAELWVANEAVSASEMMNCFTGDRFKRDRFFELWQLIGCNVSDEMVAFNKSILLPYKSCMILRHARTMIPGSLIMEYEQPSGDSRLEIRFHSPLNALEYSLQEVPLVSHGI